MPTKHQQNANKTQTKRKQNASKTQTKRKQNFYFVSGWKIIFL